jgi:hypothetical protein
LPLLYAQPHFNGGQKEEVSDDNNFFGLTDDEYEILLEDIDQAVVEGNRKYGYDYGYGEDVESQPKPRSKLRPQIYYNRVRRNQSNRQQLIGGSDNIDR